MLRDAGNTPEFMVLITKMMSFGGFEFGTKPDLGGECIWANYFSSDYFHVPSVPRGVPWGAPGVAPPKDRGGYPPPFTCVRHPLKG